jgi:hypothetical protein
MIRFKLCMRLLCLMLYGIVFGQNLEPLETAFRAFEYEEVIKLADDLLVEEDSLGHLVRIEILCMRAIAAYSLDQEIEAEKVFLRILDLDKNFSLNEQETSPKIIDFFEKIKSTYEPKEELLQTEPAPEIDSTLYFYRNAVSRSLLLPGWGHLYLQRRSKALLLGVPASASLVTGVYYIFLTSKREKEYLNETNEIEIDIKYKAYNSAYKTRNVLFASYTLIWIYCQYDLLKNGEEYIQNKTKLSIYPVIKKDFIPHVALRINF